MRTIRIYLLSTFLFMGISCCYASQAWYDSQTTGTSVKENFSFVYYGTPLKAYCDWKKIDSAHVAFKQNGLTNLKETLDFIKENKIFVLTGSFLLEIKEDLMLNDWGFLVLLDEFTKSLSKEKQYSENFATTLLAYLLTESGYDVRLAKDAKDKLYLLYHSNEIVYNKKNTNVNNKHYYMYTRGKAKTNDSIPQKLDFLNANFVGNKAVDFNLPASPKLAKVMSEGKRKSTNLMAGWDFTIKVNKNLMDFYNDYPVSGEEKNYMTKFTKLAETPLSEEAKEQLYPSIKKLMKGNDQLTNVNHLLSWIQYGFAYQLDEKEWGSDRPFFPEETLYYPYCDSEDRSALFARLVHDLLGLETIYLYSKIGHVCIGVHFTDKEVEGDNYIYEGKKYIICDPTYYGASAGKAMKRWETTRVYPIKYKKELAQGTKVENKSVVQNIAKPVTPVKENKETFAVIIGNENYLKVAKVAYARNDARTFAEFCRDKLNLPKDNIRLYEDATYGNMISAMADIKRIAKAYKGKINVIFYYAGHGIPDEDTKDAFLMPIDVDGLSTEVCYPLAKLYKELDDLKANSVTAFMDACFSGSERGNGMVVAARGVALKVKNDAPKGNTVVFTAATDKQTAYPYEEKKHGMFTYYLLEKLRETNGNCTLGELSNYVIEEVNKRAVVANGKEQTPVVLTSMGANGEWRNHKLK